MDYKKIGSFLRKEREQKGLSFHQVYEITKIQPSILRSIELGEPKISEIFYKNFIKTYVKFLGLDWKQVLKEGVDKKLVKPKKKEELKKKQEFSFQWKGFAFIGIALALLFILFVFISKKNSKEVKETQWNGDMDPNLSQETEPLGIDTEEKLETEEELSSEQETTTEEDTRDEQESETEEEVRDKQESEIEEAKKQESEIEEAKKQESEIEEAKKQESETKVKTLVQQQKMFEKIQQGNFEQELMIKSLESIKIYFKLDKKAIVSKDLKPGLWFVIKAKESIYIRFDEQVDQVEMFYNGVKWNFKSSRFFEKTFTTESSL